MRTLDVAACSRKLIASISDRFSAPLTRTVARSSLSYIDFLHLSPKAPLSSTQFWWEKEDSRHVPACHSKVLEDREDHLLKWFHKNIQKLQNKHKMFLFLRLEEVADHLRR